jgi:hypothetical protein
MTALPKDGKTRNNQRNVKQVVPKSDSKARSTVRPPKDDSWVEIDRDLFSRLRSSNEDLLPVSINPIVKEKEIAPSDFKFDLKENLKDDESKACNYRDGIRKLAQLLSPPSRGVSRRGFYYRTRTNYGGSIQTNSSAAGKFQVQFAGAPTLANTLISSSSEWTSFNVIFEEFFIHSMKLHYIPNNQFLAGYLDATSTHWNSGMFSLAGYQHDQPTPTDGLSNFYLFQNAGQHKLANTGLRFVFLWRNVEKFAKDGPAGDATTAANTQSWLNFANVSNVGGYIVGCLPVATNAAAGPSTVAVNGLLGYFTVEWDVSFRYRD